MRSITVHGRESATDVPLAHVDRIVARLKVSSLLRSEFGFHEVIFEQPVVHVAFYPDGATNFPQRQGSVVAGKPAVEQLFALSINRFELRHGQILWDDKTIPVDLAAHDASLQMDYSFLRGRYDGSLQLGLVDTKLMDCRPFAWMASVEFSLASGSAAVPSLKWNSGHSHFSASGQITDFRRPHLQGSYEAQFDLTEAASIARRRELRAGLLELKGHGEWSLDQFASNGLLTLRDLGWQNDQISFSKASLNTDYSVTDQQLKLSKLQARDFRRLPSRVTPNSISGWRLGSICLQRLEKILRPPLFPPLRPESAVKTPKPKPPAIQNAVVLLRLHDLSAEDLAEALNAPAHPFPRYHPAASASGTLETRWKGTPRDAEVQFALDLTPPEHPVPAHLRISARAHGVYYAATDTLDLPQFTLTTPTSHVQASGTSIVPRPQSASPFPPPVLLTGCPLSRSFAVPRCFQSC